MRNVNTIVPLPYLFAYKPISAISRDPKLLTQKINLINTNCKCVILGYKPRAIFGPEVYRYHDIFVKIQSDSVRKIILKAIKWMQKIRNKRLETNKGRDRELEEGSLIVTRLPKRFRVLLCWARKNEWHLHGAKPWNPGCSISTRNNRFLDNSVVLEFKSIPSEIQQFAQTEAYGHVEVSQSEAASTSCSATRSFLGGRNKSRKIRLLSAGYTVASHQTVSHLTTGFKNVNFTIHATAFKLKPFELYKEAWLSIKFAHPDWRIIWKKNFVMWPRSGASYCLYNYGA